MKKILIAFTAAILGLASVHAKKWNNIVGVGFTLPISSIDTDQADSDDIFQLGYGIEGTYLGFHESGLTVKADLGVGLSTTKDVNLQGDGTNLGIFYNVALGAGWTFVKTERFTLSATGMAGADFFSYNDSEDKVTLDSKEYESIDKILMLGLLSAGADIFASYRVSDHFSFFANVAARYFIIGRTTEEINWTWKEEDYEKTTSGTKSGPDLEGKFRIQPTIGIAWKF